MWKKRLFLIIISFLLHSNVCHPSAGFVHSTFFSPHCLNLFILLGQLLRNSLCSPVAQWWCWDRSCVRVHTVRCKYARWQLDHSAHPVLLTYELRWEKSHVFTTKNLRKAGWNINRHDNGFYTVFLHVVTARYCGFNFPVLKLLMPSGKKLIIHVFFFCLFVVVAMLWLQVAKSSPFAIKKHVPHSMKDRESVKPGYSGQFFVYAC